MSTTHRTYLTKNDFVVERSGNVEGIREVQYLERHDLETGSRELIEWDIIVRNPDDIDQDSFDP